MATPKRKWIKAAINPAHKGALHQDLGVPEGQKIPEAKLEAATHSSDPTVAKRANLAKTMKGFHHGAAEKLYAKKKVSRLMADAPKKGAAALYGKPSKIVEDKRDGDTEKSGAPKKAAAKAEESAGSPKTETENKSEGDSGTEAKGDVMAGTDGIETHHTHSAERTEMHHRHMLDHAHLHGRHMHDHAMRVTGHHAESHADMGKRHNEEKRSLHTRHEQEHRAMTQRHASVPFSADAPAPEGAAPAA